MKSKGFDFMFCEIRKDVANLFNFVVGTFVHVCFGLKPC